MKRTATAAFVNQEPEISEEDIALLQQDPYYEGLDLRTMLALESGSLPAVDHMLMDCSRGIKVIIGFCERHQEDNAKTLKKFIQDHPEFAFLIRPILDYDSEYGGGEIYFQRMGDKVKALIKLIPVFQYQVGQEIPLELTPDLFRNFLQSTEPFGCFMANNGEMPLNFG